MEQLSIKCPGIVSDELRGTIMELIEPGSLTELARWWVQYPAIPKPTLPAILRRIGSAGIGEPTVFFDECRESHMAAAAQSRELGRTAPAHGPVEDRAPVTSMEPAEAFAAIRAKFRDLDEKILRQLKAMTPIERTHFCLEHCIPLSVAADLEPQDSQRKESEHDWSI